MKQNKHKKYNLGPKMLYCDKPDPMSISGYCEGILDYDSSFNFLVCRKCGAVCEPKVKFKDEVDKDEAFREVCAAANNAMKEILEKLNDLG